MQTGQSSRMKTSVIPLCFSDQVMFGSLIYCTTIYEGNAHRRLSISPVGV
jgi:hypothetical protein